MKTSFHKLPLATAIAVGLMGIGSSAAYAGATIFSTTGSIALGINNEGHLNTPDGSVVVNSSATGVAYKFPNGSYYDATSPGCLCEGWGVSVNGTNFGYGSVDYFGVNNLTVNSFTLDPALIPHYATSSVHLTDLPSLTVTQSYTPSITLGNEQILFRDVVTITNTSTDLINGGLTDLKFVRVMDWDVPPTEFSEYVTIAGTAPPIASGVLEESGDNGFNIPDPLALYSNFDPACHNLDCTDSGPSDHGAYFRFNFGALAAGASKSFEIFYGAAGSESLALAAIAREGIGLYSLGQSNGGQITGEPATYIFGFKGAGGLSAVPEPMSLALMGIGMAGLAASRRRSIA